MLENVVIRLVGIKVGQSLGLSSEWVPLQSLRHGVDKAERDTEPLIENAPAVTPHHSEDIRLVNAASIFQKSEDLIRPRRIVIL